MSAGKTGSCLQESIRFARGHEDQEVCYDNPLSSLKYVCSDCEGLVYEACKFIVSLSWMLLKLTAEVTRFKDFIAVLET